MKVDRNGMRIVIELKRDVNANIVLNNLYKHSQMEDTFSVIMLALVNGEPRVLNLKGNTIPLCSTSKGCSN